MDQPNFEAWDQATLAKFARECYDKLREKDDIILQLTDDFKTAIKAYRDLLL